MTGKHGQNYLSRVDNSYIGLVGFTEQEDHNNLIEFFKEHEIISVQGGSQHKVADIGFSPKEQKWYGWSHRAIYGFGIGSEIKEGDCGYEKSGAWTAKTLNEARLMAINFADSVS